MRPIRDESGTGSDIESTRIAYNRGPTKDGA